MKIILSRKGFDSSSGGCPSPILPDGRLRSLPIPDPYSAIKYSSIHSHDDYPTGSIVESLTKGKIAASDGAHHDPDIDPTSRSRAKEWRGVFGQSGAAQSHLEKQQVGIGDVFLFFGLYRRTVEVVGHLAFERKAPKEHVIWGWLQIGEIVRIEAGASSPFAWCKDHPHVSHAKQGRHNTVYVASKNLTIPGVDSSLPGSGIFPKYDPHLRLTAEESKSPLRWRLPSWFAPHNGKSLSMHSDVSRWQPCQEFRDMVLLESVRRGQEFVIDIGNDRTAKKWLLGILDTGR